jgi:hydroxyacylglutathione hydrolase
VKEVAAGVWRLSEFPPRPVINVYLADDVLIDAGRTWDTGRIRRQTAGRKLSMLALTHVHPDHQGAAKAICTERDIPLACHEADVDAMEGRRPVQEAAPNDIRNKVIRRLWEGPPHEVDRPFNEGEEVAGFRVIHAPGHQRGEVIFWRESDRVAICGDVVRNMSYATTLAGVREPPEVFTYDVSENRRSIRKLAQLRPALTLPGHGPEIRGFAEIEALADRVGA